jgi:prophage DNA circulation protein
MNYYEIASLTELQVANVIELNRVLHKFQRSLVNNDILEFESAVDEQEKILTKIRNSETKRFSVLKELLNENNIPVDSEAAVDKLAELIAETDEEAFKKFNDARENLLSSVHNVVLLNMQNEVLINNSRLFIRDLVRNLLGTKKDSFFDRKV